MFAVFPREPLSKNALKKLEKEKKKAEAKAEREAKQVWCFVDVLDGHVLLLKVKWFFFFDDQQSFWDFIIIVTSNSRKMTFKSWRGKNCS